jgi:hypothetical protein
MSDPHFVHQRYFKDESGNSENYCQKEKLYEILLTKGRDKFD